MHHGSNQQYLDRNYGGVLIIWDRMFGTFEPEGERVRYGLTKNIETFNPLRVAFHEWGAIWRDVRGASRWRDRIGYMFRGPGWRPADAPPAPDRPAQPLSVAESAPISTSSASTIAGSNCVPALRRSSSHASSTAIAGR